MEEPNLDFFEKLAKGDNAFMARLVKALKEDFNEDEAGYIAALETRDFDSMVYRVHRIKHKAGILGLEKNYILAGNYENDLKQKNLNLETDFQNTLEMISRFLKAL